MFCYYSDRGEADENEDYAYACESFGFVVDGATPPRGSSWNPPFMGSPAGWLSRRIGERLASLLSSGCALVPSIASSLVACIAELEQLSPDFRSVDKADLPTAALSAFTIVDGVLSYAVAGDSPLYIVHVDGAVDEIWDRRLADLDSRKLRLAERIAHEAGIGIAEAKEDPRYIEASRAIRRLRNTSDGYSVIEPDISCLASMETGEMDASGISAAIAATDGFARIPRLGIMPVRSIAELEPYRLPALVADLRRLERSDAGLKSIPRHKASDDASVAIVRLDTRLS